MKRFLLLSFFLKLNFFLFGQTSNKISKPAIDSIAIKNWVRLGSSLAISNDGNYFMYNVSNPSRRGSTLIVQSLVSNWKKELPFVDNGFFAQGNNQFIFQRNDSIYFFQLETDRYTVIPSIVGLRQPKNIKGKWVAYKLKNDSQELVVLNLLSGKEQRFNFVTDYLFGDNGNVLFIKKSIKHGDENITSLDWVNLETGKVDEIWYSDRCSNCTVENYSIDANEKQAVFIVQEKKEGVAVNTIWYYKSGTKKALEKISNKGIADDLILAASTLKFSVDGKYIFFNLQQPEKKKVAPSGVSLDIWSYKDTLIQSTQLYQSTGSYDAVINTEEREVIRLTHDYEEIKAWPKKGEFVVIQYNDEGDRFWLKQKPKNFLVSLKNGNRTPLTSGIGNEFWFSPDGSYLVYYEFNKKGRYFCYNLLTGECKSISHGITEPVNGVDEFFKGRINQGSVGVAGWVEKEEILIYDNYDIWKLNLTGTKAPVNITNGYGRIHKIKFKVIKSLENPSITFASNDTLLLSAFNLKNKYNGFFQKAISDSKSPDMLVMGPYTFFNRSTQTNAEDFDTGIKPVKATSKNVWILNRQSFNEHPNYFATSDFRTFKKLTDLNPQKGYNWLNAELHSWKQFDGKMSQGILYKPENFDANKKYPIIFNYYEQLSDRLYQFPRPSYTNHNINVPWFVSQGYLVFTPDIHFQSGRPGQSVYNSVVSAAKYLQSLPFIDGRRMGINGHSTGGFETNYLITHSDLFAAAVEGAGVSNSISSYLQLSGVPGKDRGTRLPLELNYGATLWEKPDLYIGNSPVFKADKVTTPLIIFHSKDDTAVPWEQGVEFYLALRRLNKPAWMLQYDGQGHGNSAGPYARDFTIRITQFFNHYLKGTPAPVWMTKGISAFMKGIETGYELDPTGNCGMEGMAKCKLCNKWNEKYKKTSKAIMEWY